MFDVIYVVVVMAAGVFHTAVAVIITIIVMIIVFVATVIITLLCTRPTCRTTQWAGPSVVHRKSACERRGAPAVLAMSFTLKQRPTEFGAA